MLIQFKDLKLGEHRISSQVNSTRMIDEASEVITPGIGIRVGRSRTHTHALVLHSHSRTQELLNLIMDTMKIKKTH